MDRCHCKYVILNKCHYYSRYRYVSLEFEKIRTVPLHHIFRQKSLLTPITRGTYLSVAFSPPSSLFSFPLPLCLPLSSTTTIATTPSSTTSAVGGLGSHHHRRYLQPHLQWEAGGLGSCHCHHHRCPPSSHRDGGRDGEERRGRMEEDGTN